MKVTMILRDFSFGGAEHVVYELVRHIAPSQADVTIICCGTKQNNAVSDKVEAACSIKYLGLASKISLSSIWKVIKALDEINPDVIHAHMGSTGYAAIWSLVRKKGFVATVHTRPDKAFNKKIEFLLRLRMLLKKSCLVAVSKENALLVKEYYRLSEGKYTSVNNGIDLSKFYSAFHEPFTYINVARQDDNKNQRMLLKSFAKVKRQCKDTRLILVGNGPLHETLKNDAKDMGIADSVWFTGNVSDVENYYAQSDAFVLCSYREAMPLSVLEAMAAGLPIISSRVGGLVDVVQNNGILLEENSEECLTQAMINIYDNRFMRKQWQQASQTIVQRFSAQEMAEQYLRIYRQLMR